MNKRSIDLSRLLLHLLLLPFVLFWVPVIFAMAWVQELAEDLRPTRLRTAPAYLPTTGPLPRLTRARPYR